MQVGVNLPPAANPVWSPDSQQLLVFANAGVSTEDPDWWIAPLHGNARRTGAFAMLRSQGLAHLAPPYARASEWRKDKIIFSAQTGDTRNVWQAPFRANGQITGGAERLTQGTTLEISPTVAGASSLVFASVQQSIGIWTVPVNPNERKVTGPVQRISEGDAWEVSPGHLDRRADAGLSVESSVRRILAERSADGQEVGRRCHRIAAIPSCRVS